jgi:cobalt/nickel transport system permease protein
MTGTIDQLPCPESALRHLDPRWKLAALLSAVLAVPALQTLRGALAAVAVALVLAMLGRLPRRWTLLRLGTVALLVAPFLLLLPLLHRAGGPSWELGPVALSLHGFDAGLLLGLKTLALTLLVLVLLTSAPLADTFKAAQALRVPSLLVQLALLTYRYVFVLTAELSRLRVALRVRGYRNRANLHSYRTVGHVAGMLLVRGYERAERVGQAMRCRGFDGRFRSLTEFRTRLADVVFFVLTVGSVAVLIAWDWASRER